ncbi:unnamed protein product [Caenorhabditis auriculariae]|uniref:Uncharacterized protein n=1 Tax=Caenorhabditis auriculariae TaxID=2777116 RepID=A0A8S1HP85_9PELO|nr:unnamed protein product [Caenorhabditis auriculariae]
MKEAWEEAIFRRLSTSQSAALSSSLTMLLRRALLLFLLVLAASAISYSRFGKYPQEEHREEQPLSINEQMMRGSPIVYYGRFRDGADDVLNRFFNRL